jgi:hypothetical protein
MSEPRYLFDITRGLLFPLAVIPLLVVPFGGGCALLLTIDDRSSMLAWGIMAAMAVSVVGNVVMLMFIGTGQPTGVLAKMTMMALALLDFGFAAGLASQGRAGSLPPLALAAGFVIKGLLVLVFVFAKRPEDPPTFPRLPR